MFYTHTNILLLCHISFMLFLCINRWKNSFAYTTLIRFYTIICYFRVITLVWCSFDWTVTTWACFCLNTLPLFLQSEIKTSEGFDGNDKRLLKKECFWILAVFYGYHTHCSKMKMIGKNLFNFTSQGFWETSLMSTTPYVIYPLPKFSIS